MIEAGMEPYLELGERLAVTTHHLKPLSRWQPLPYLHWRIMKAIVCCTLLRPALTRRHSTHDSFGRETVRVSRAVNGFAAG
jgi:hypothetical protein